jgi:hypothetical protein
LVLPPNPFHEKTVGRPITEELGCLKEDGAIIEGRAPTPRVLFQKPDVGVPGVRSSPELVRASRGVDAVTKPVIQPFARKMITKIRIIEEARSNFKK